MADIAEGEGTTQAVLRRALSELDAAAERKYFDEDADRAAAERYYENVEPGPDGPALFRALSRLLESSHGSRPAYSPAVALYPWIDLQPDGKLRSIYTGDEFDPRTMIEEAAEIESRRAGLRVAARGRESAAAVEAELERLHPYNCEHSVCQSWFAHAEPMRGDLHSLFTCERKCNSFRRNFPYFDYPDFLEKVREDCGRVEPTGFEPSGGKGAVARATLYFLLRYPDALHGDDLADVYSEESLTMLLQWHEAEAVSPYERHRNAAIFERQGNRNPLIDHPEWAPQIAFAAGL